jgi:uncharacterized protein YcsI (UPF0317 family)
MPETVQTTTGLQLRRLARSGDFAGQTAGQAPDHLQGNVVILPLRYAADFLLFCLNNPKPCPLIGVSMPGETGIAGLGADIDIRHDVPAYRVFRDGAFVEQVGDIADIWSDDLVTFVLGCSFTFEEALIREGYGVRHIAQGRNVPMFNTNIATIKAGVFEGPVVVTMRPYRAEFIPAIVDLCRRYPHAHGAPLYWGDPAVIGIDDLTRPDYGDPGDLQRGETPVFWACGVTPQAAIAAAKPELCITHAPGSMLVTDLPSETPPVVTTAMADLTDQTKSN